MFIAGFSPLLSLTLRVNVLKMITIKEIFVDLMLFLISYMNLGWPDHMTSSG